MEEAEGLYREALGFCPSPSAPGVGLIAESRSGDSELLISREVPFLMIFTRNIKEPPVMEFGTSMLKFCRSGPCMIPKFQMRARVAETQGEMSDTCSTDLCMLDIDTHQAFDFMSCLLEQL